MRHQVKLSGAWLLAGLLVLVSSTSCTEHQEPSAETGAIQAQPVQGSFVARLYSVVPGSEDALIEHLHGCYLPVWNQLRIDGVVSSISVFQLDQTDLALTEVPPWRFLLLAELGPQAKPGDLLMAEIAAACHERSESGQFRVLCAQHMACTPNSCHKLPQPTYPDAAEGIDYLVEFIGVEDTPEYLAKYHELMANYFGPANGILVEEGKLHSFIGLETTDVLSADIGVPSWNQLHISDDWDVGGEVDWDAIYGDLFRREFSRELDDVWNEMPPARDRPFDYTGRLVPSLCLR